MGTYLLGWAAWRCTPAGLGFARFLTGRLCKGNELHASQLWRGDLPSHHRSSKDSCLAAGMALFCCPSRGAAKRTTLEPVTVPPAWPAHSLQTGLPMTGLAVLAGEWRFKPEVMNLLT